MAGQRQPIDLVLAKGKKHLTKREIEERQATEPRVAKVKSLRPPDYLPEDLRMEFVKLSKELGKIGLLSKLDCDVLARYFMSRESWLAAHRRAIQEMNCGDAKEAGKWARIEKTYFDQCHTCAANMGLTISSRCRLVMPKLPEDPAEADPLAKLLEGGR